MTEEELEKRFVDAVEIINLCKDVITEANVICQDVEHGRYGDALMHNQKYWAKLEKLRQYEEKTNGTD